MNGEDTMDEDGFQTPARTAPRTTGQDAAIDDIDVLRQSNRFKALEDQDDDDLFFDQYQRMQRKHAASPLPTPVDRPRVRRTVHETPVAMQTRPQEPNAANMPFGMADTTNGPPAGSQMDDRNMEGNVDGREETKEMDVDGQHQRQDGPVTVGGTDPHGGTSEQAGKKRSKRTKKKKTGPSDMQDDGEPADTDPAHPSRWTARTIDDLETLPARPSVDQLRSLSDVALKVLMQANGISRPHGSRMPENLLAFEEWLQTHPGRELQFPASIRRRSTAPMPPKGTRGPSHAGQPWHPASGRPAADAKPTDH